MCILSHKLSRRLSRRLPTYVLRSNYRLYYIPRNTLHSRGNATITAILCTCSPLACNRPPLPPPPRKVKQTVHLPSLEQLRDKNMTIEAQTKNWFSTKKALDVYGIYLSLDTDGNGMLSKEELSRCI